MEQSNEHTITINIAGVRAFKLPVSSQSEESLVRHVVTRINEHMQNFTYGANPKTKDVALAMIALYYATMQYRNIELLRSQNSMLDNFETRLDKLLAGTD